MEKTIETSQMTKGKRDASVIVVQSLSIIVFQPFMNYSSVIKGTRCWALIGKTKLPFFTFPQWMLFARNA